MSGEMLPGTFRVASILEALEQHLKKRTNNRFIFPQGEIEFFNINSNTVGIFLIEIKQEFQRQGIFTSLMKAIVENDSINKVIITEVCNSFSVILQTTKFGEGYFESNGFGELTWNKTVPYKTVRPKLIEMKQLLKTDTIEFNRRIYFPEVWCLL